MAAAVLFRARAAGAPLMASTLRITLTRRTTSMKPSLLISRCTLCVVTVQLEATTIEAADSSTSPTSDFAPVACVRRFCQSERERRAPGSDVARSAAVIGAVCHMHTCWRTRPAMLQHPLAHALSATSWVIRTHMLGQAVRTASAPLNASTLDHFVSQTERWDQDTNSLSLLLFGAPPGNACFQCLLSVAFRLMQPSRAFGAFFLTLI